MANYYLEFSTLVKCPSAEAQEWLVGRFVCPHTLCPSELDKLTEAQINEMEERWLACCAEKQTGIDAPWGVWIYTEESGIPETVAEVIAEYQLKFEDHNEFYLSWACSCSKPRIDVFGGGAVHVRDGVISWLPVDEWHDAADAGLTVTKFFDGHADESIGLAARQKYASEDVRIAETPAFVRDPDNPDDIWVMAMVRVTEKKMVEVTPHDTQGA